MKAIKHTETKLLDGSILYRYQFDGIGETGESFPFIATANVFKTRTADEIIFVDNFVCNNPSNLATAELYVCAHVYSGGDVINGEWDPSAKNPDYPQMAPIPSGDSTLNAGSALAALVGFCNFSELLQIGIVQGVNNTASNTPFTLQFRLRTLNKKS